MEKQRLDKFIANQMIISRTESKSAIRSGKVSIDGVTVRDPSAVFDACKCEIKFCGGIIKYKKHIYIMMNKPAGILSAATDKSKKTVVDLVPDGMRRNGLFPVGRLDKDTTGLIIITDDGEFAHNCISPKKKVEKSYVATLDGDIGEKTVQAFEKGVVLADGTVCKSAKLERISENICRIIISEGKYHQIKRMFGTVGLGVNALHRERIGRLSLPDGLEEGKCTELDEKMLELALFSE